MDVSAIVAFVGFCAACTIAASMGAIFRPGEWYEQLLKPAWRPPNWLFAPAWTFLYLTIAVSGWLVWHTYGFAGAAVPLSVYAVQLTLNAAWTPIFFGLHRIGAALVEILTLWVAIAATIAAFAQLHVVAACLLVPYLAWVTFAGALNFSIWRLNR
jgi:tryptophan-rich sensory protein